MYYYKDIIIIKLDAYNQSADGLVLNERRFCKQNELRRYNEISSAPTFTPGDSKVLLSLHLELTPSVWMSRHRSQNQPRPPSAPNVDFLTQYNQPNNDSEELNLDRTSGSRISDTSRTLVYTEPARQQPY